MNDDTLEILISLSTVLKTLLMVTDDEFRMSDDDVLRFRKNAVLELKQVSERLRFYTGETEKEELQ